MRTRRTQKKVGQCKAMIRKAYRILVGTPDIKQPFGRHIQNWENIIKKDLNGI
jgi:hypothetical protein